MLLRALFLSLEFSAATFSGNGIYAMSQVRALMELGHQLLVVSARPAGTCTPAEQQLGGRLMEVEVPSWGRLDAGAPWREYAQGAAQAHVVEAVRQFQPQVVLGVDWSALPAYNAICQQLEQPPPPPLVFLCYRVFTRTALGAELQLVRSLEAAALRQAAATLALSRADAEYLAAEVAEGGAGPPQARSAPPPQVLLCALRADMHAIEPPPYMQAHIAAATAAAQLQQQRSPPPHAAAALLGAGEPEGSPDSDASLAAAQQQFVRSRPYLMCCVRLSAEKEPQRFVELVEAMAARGSLARLGLTPLLVAGAARDEFAQGLKARLLAAAPSARIVESFLGPQELAELHAQTRLNFHPATYDAYGMTIIEAASQGAPSLVQAGGSVGATDLLRGEPQQDVFTTDLSAGAAAVAEVAEAILSDVPKLFRVACAAADTARSWGEADNAKALAAVVHTALTAQAS